MNVLLLALPLVLVLGAILLGLIGRRRRRRRLAVASTVALPIHPNNSGGLAEAHSLAGAENGVWRPPPRQQLLRLQQEKAQQRAHRDDLARRLSDVRRRSPGGWSTTHPSPVPSPSADPARELLPTDQTPAAESGATLSSRLGRKRQGLDSLITERPQDTKDASSEL